MRRLKYLSILTLILGSITFACNEDMVRPLGTEEEDEDPIIIPPPPPPEQGGVPIDSLDL